MDGAGPPGAGEAKKPGPLDSREQFEANLLKQVCGYDSISARTVP